VSKRIVTITEDVAWRLLRRKREKNQLTVT
jgi:hypothetical protein